MDLRKLKTLIDLVSESGISELEVTEGEGKVRIVKNAPPVYVQQPAAQYAPQYAAAPPAHPGGAIEGAAARAGDAARRCAARPCRDLADGRHVLPRAVAGRRSV